MERGAWQATVHGVARARLDLATKPPPPSYTIFDRMATLTNLNIPSLPCFHILYIWYTCFVSILRIPEEHHDLLYNTISFHLICDIQEKM